MFYCTVNDLILFNRGVWMCAEGGGGAGMTCVIVWRGK